MDLVMAAIGTLTLLSFALGTVGGLLIGDSIGYREGIDVCEVQDDEQ